MKGPTIPIVTAAEHQAHCKKNLWNLSFLDRNIRTILNSAVPNCRLIFGYVDADGCLLRLYGQGPAMVRAERAGIVEGTLWTRQAVGFNAVAEGLETNRALATGGEEHTAPTLRTYAIYFAPIQVFRPIHGKTTEEASHLGGLAAFTPVAAANENDLLLTVSIAHDVMMTLHFNQSATGQYEKRPAGVLTTDNFMQPGQVLITYVSDMLFRVLDIPPEDVCFQPLERLFRREENAAFWEMVEEGTAFYEQPVTLTVHGQSRTCIITAEEYNQPGLKVGGLIISITTPRMESRKISRKMANSAVLSFRDIVGDSTQIQAAIRRASLIAQTESNVMILGESGVGKDVFAQAIHNASSRRDMPFIAVNCGALPRELIASELFGYDSGAFTGAKKNGNIGKFELADRGTIFLDEIGELPLDLQATLLRVVEQKQFMRLGSSKLIDIDVKIISATNADIPRMIEQKLFRADLFYRLSTLKLSLPPLRERGRDVILLANYFIQSICRRIGRSRSVTLSREAEELLLDMPWSGNIRELQNLMECIVQLYDENVITPQRILENANIPVPSAQGQTGPAGMPAGPYDHMPDIGRTRKRRPVTEEDIREALRLCDNNRSEAAERLEIGRKTLYRYLEKFGIK